MPTAGHPAREPLVEPEPEVAALPHQRADGQHRGDGVAQDQADRLEPRQRVGRGASARETRRRTRRSGRPAARPAAARRPAASRASTSARDTRTRRCQLPAMKPPSISASSHACGSSGRCSSTTRVTSRNGIGYSARTCWTSRISAPGLAQAAVCGDAGKSFRAINVTAASLTTPSRSTCSRTTWPPRPWRRRSRNGSYRSKGRPSIARTRSPTLQAGLRRRAGGRDRPSVPGTGKSAGTLCRCRRRRRTPAGPGTST